MDMKLELVPLPVADVDRAKAFYVETLGFHLDVDVTPADSVRVVQVTPPGSGCSVGFGTGLEAYVGEPGTVRALHLVVEDVDAARAEPGTVRALHLVVEDVDAARAELVARGVDVGPVTDVGGGVRYAGFADPDGNTLELQEMAWRRGETF